jgi:hypothetical protein
MIRTSDGAVPSPPVRLPDSDDGDRQAVLDSLDAMRDALPALRGTCSDRFAVLLTGVDIPPHGEALALSIPLLETVLDREPSEVPPAELAQLAFFSLFPAVPEQFALQIAFGWSIAHEHVRDCAPQLEEEDVGAMSADGYLAGLDPWADVFDTRAGRRFRGESLREPSRERVERGIAAFRRAAAHAPEALRPPLLCVVAWLFWAIGKRPHGLAHLAGIGRHDFAGDLVQALREHLATHAPLWAPRSTQVPVLFPRK